jgi:hypothetical protein
MIDYSRFDSIDVSDDEDDENLPSQSSSDAEFASAAPEVPGVQSMKMTPKTSSGRLKFEFDGRTIYEWEQSLDECNIYIRPPPGVTKQLLDIQISFTHLKVGIKGSPPFIDEDVFSTVVTEESFWTMSDGELNISLQKMKKGETWDCPLVGRAGQAVDAFTRESERKKMMLERFQEEHPGFDFSGAEFNGSVPDARAFMGGIKY